ncbi:MAG: hypothetical protein KJ653_07310 [Candidatus Thermoplasmatota archaeon]|nr:hypothetical protein [Candidatus Thermoplasmatota archaeon]
MCKPIGLNQRLWIGLLSFLACLILVEYIIPFGSFDAGPASSLLTVITGLFLGAIVSKAIYDHINRESQKRQWRHDYALTRVKEIYAPLWDETMDALTALNDYREPRNLYSEYRSVDGQRDAQMGFRQMEDSHLGLFIDGNARDLLKHFHDSLDNYRSANSVAWRDIHVVLEQNVQKVMEKYSSQGSPNDMIMAYQSHLRVVFDAQADVRSSRDQYSSAHEFISHSRQAAHEDYGETLTALRNLESVESVRNARGAAVVKGAKALGRLKDIINDPSSVVLDFDEGRL